MRVARLCWLEVEPGVVGDSSSLSSLSTGSSGMARGSSSERGPLTGVLRPPELPLEPSSSVEMAKRGISMMAEQQRRRTVRGGLESLSVCEDSDTDRRLRRLQQNTQRNVNHQRKYQHTIIDFLSSTVVPTSHRCMAK